MKLKLSSVSYLYGCRVGLYIAIRCVFFSCLLLASWYTKSASEESIDAGVLLAEVRDLESPGLWVFKEVCPELVPECRSNERFLLIIDSVLFVDKHSLVDGILHFDDGESVGLDMDIETKMEDYLVLCLISMLEASLHNETFDNNPNNISAKDLKLAEKIYLCNDSLLEINTDNILVDIEPGEGLLNYAAVGKFTINGDGEIECNIKDITYNTECSKSELQIQKIVVFGTESYSMLGASINKEDESKSIKYYKCDVCNKMLSNSDSLKVHMNMHNKTDASKCYLCCKYYTSNATLKRHYANSHFMRREYVCETCNERFTKYSDCKNHKIINCHHYIPVCDYCNEVFSSRSVLARHYKTCKEKLSSDNGKCTGVGKVPSGGDKIESNIKNIICNDGESNLELQTQKAGWLDAKIDHISGTSVNKNNKIKYNESRKCDVCGKIFCHLESLKNHMKTHNRSSAYECSLCCNSYVAKANLKKHLAGSHSIYTDYVCYKCQEVFTVYMDYRKHRMMHAR
ncbi:MAG: C2H2-type zinc finger protein [Candidatus Endonucleobacter bathymodioli]|uniref:C2H2-type zinc finger protein n=1 Tax=Candidatus Endonucleibacter bathymodioli TaxID=539814 RepID=A0AA90NXX3_9GAMM|nr:C2H2-type zinc finger protein [Candidatus Endonucleobacter bathymodioli]